MQDFQLDNDDSDNQTGNASFTSTEVLAEIEDQKNKKQSWVNNLLILAVSLIVFVNLGLIRYSVTDILILIVVLLIHETGHLLAMRLFGYQNVQMFFIPFFGAAVSGRSDNVAGYKKALVSLMGPVPGIFIGIGCLIANLFTVSETMFTVGMMFILINGFNLLPFFPLDGGRLVYEVLFCRNQYLELCFRVLAALALIGVGLLLGAWFLTIFGVFNLIGVHFPFKLSKIATRLKRSAATDAPGQFNTILDDKPDNEEMTHEITDRIICEIDQNMTGTHNLKTVAGFTS